MATKRMNEKAFMLAMEEDDFTSDDEHSMQQIDTDDDDDGGSSDYATQPHILRQTKRLQSTTDELHKLSKKIQRMPTRRPNPKVSNRNALMARENRRKKKELLENLQKSVDDTQTENQKLKKLLRVRNTTISKLTQESLYLRSILANKTEIMSLLKTIQGNRTPITSSTLSFVADTDADAIAAVNDATTTNIVGHTPKYQYNEISSNNKRTPSYASSVGGTSPYSSHSSHSTDDHRHGTTTRPMDLNASDPFLTATSITQPYSLFTDLDLLGFERSTSPMRTPFADDDAFQWQNMLSDASALQSIGSSADVMNLADIDDSEILSTKNIVNNEHNYFNNPIVQKVVAAAATADVGTNASNKSKPGICLHISSGRVSLEFCAQCHINSQNAWIEEM